MTRDEFKLLKDQFLTPAAPIQSPEHLLGRDVALNGLVDALSSPGRHAFVYGFRGVGKTSLAQTAAFQLQSAQSAPLIVSCDSDSTFKSVLKQIVKRGAKINPLERKSSNSFSLAGGITAIGNASVSKNSSTDEVKIEIGDVSDAENYLSALCEKLGHGLVCVIDEFDQIKDTSQHKYFASLIKALSDNHVPVKIIFCGIADTVNSLFSEHQSIFRQMHSVEVERLKIQPRIDIVDAASGVLKIEIEDNFKFRIAQISDGFPSFIHLISEKIFTNSFDKHETSISRESYETGLQQAVTSVETALRKQYEDAVHKNTKKSENVIWAVAADRLLTVNVDKVWGKYCEFSGTMNYQNTERVNMNVKLNQLCTPAYGSILSKPRRSNFTFTEQMMRAYARLRAATSGLDMGYEAL
jgi:uncharacterized protein